MLEFAAMLAFAVVGQQVSAADTTIVRGIVFDSIAARPLAGASVQLVRADSSSSTGVFAATTDSAGRFTVRAPTGRYIAGFFHPMLDTLGLELRDRVVDVAATNATVTLATPSPQTLIRGFCGDSSSAISRTLIFGQVYDARSASAIENASVTVGWAEAEQTPTGLDIGERTGSATTRSAGFFALCGVPTDAALSVRVSQARDSATVNVRIPASGVLHLRLFLANGGTTGRIVGHVVDRMKRSVAAARAMVGNRESTVNNAGQFLLDSVPAGSQSIDVRAIGYAPVSFMVNVAEGQITNVDVALDRVVALPGVESRATAATDHLATYVQAKRADPTGARFIEPMRLEGYPASQSVCMLVSILRGASSCRALQACQKFFLNGTRVTYQLEDIDADDIVGVEVFGSHWPAIYSAYERLNDGTCPMVVFTRCPEIEIRCGKNPASQPIRRPDDPASLEKLAARAIEAHVMSEPIRTRA